MGSRRMVAAIGLALLLAGCASSVCPGERTGGWFSGWGSGGAGAFTLGLRRAWGTCDAKSPAVLGPPPPADHAAQWPVSPSGTAAPR